MKTLLIVIIISTFARPVLSDASLPASLDEAAIIIIKTMKQETLESLVKIRPQDARDFDFGWDSETYHLIQQWYREPNLRTECWEPEHFEGCNGVMEYKIYKHSFDFVDTIIWEGTQETVNTLRMVEADRMLFLGQPLPAVITNLRSELQRYGIGIKIELRGELDESRKMSSRADIDYSNIMVVLDRIKVEFNANVMIESNSVVIEIRKIKKS